VLLLSAGNINDISMAEALIQAAGPFRRLLADKGYDANHFRKLLAERGAEAVIPSTASRKMPIPYDVLAYKERNRVERMWRRLKDFRRVATPIRRQLAELYSLGCTLVFADLGDEIAARLQNRSRTSDLRKLGNRGPCQKRG
jgi:transposase